MRPVFTLLIVGTLLAVAGFGFAIWRYNALFPKASTEVSWLTPGRRASLANLRAEHKFQPHDFAPLGYTGAETPADERVAARAVDNVIDTILARPDGQVSARAVSKAIQLQLRKVRPLATEDRERTQDYMLEIWYLMGFKEPTGLFAYGDYFQTPPGYGEPLPSGWKSPTEPRPIQG